jgi:hypothetical protein
VPLAYIPQVFAPASGCGSPEGLRYREFRRRVSPEGLRYREGDSRAISQFTIRRSAKPFGERPIARAEAFAL